MLLADTGYWLRSTIGVLRVLCMGERMCTLSPSEIEHYEALSDELGNVVLPGPPEFAPGQRVRITQGPFAEHVGIVKGMDTHERITVLLSLLGRQSRLTCPVGLVTGA